MATIINGTWPAFTKTLRMMWKKTSKIDPFVKKLTERVPRVGGYLPQVGKCSPVWWDEQRFAMQSVSWCEPPWQRDCVLHPDRVNAIVFVLLCRYRCFCTVVSTDVWWVAFFPSRLVQTNSSSFYRHIRRRRPSNNSIRSLFSVLLFPFPISLPSLPHLPPPPPSLSPSIPSHPLSLSLSRFPLSVLRRSRLEHRCSRLASASAFVVGGVIIYDWFSAPTSLPPPLMAF